MLTGLLCLLTHIPLHALKMIRRGQHETDAAPVYAAVHGSALIHTLRFGVLNITVFKCPFFVMPDLIRHPEVSENTGFLPSQE